MHVQINGEPREVPAGTTVADLVADLAARGQRFAVEVNEELIPRSLHVDRRLVEGDRVEVVHAIGGG
jgi:sulfur carrier protein